MAEYQDQKYKQLEEASVMVEYIMVTVVCCFKFALNTSAFLNKWKHTKSILEPSFHSKYLIFESVTIIGKIV